MTTAILEYAGHEVDADARRVGQLSAVGSLADEVLADLIKIRAGLATVGDSQALASAASLFAEAVKALDVVATVGTPLGYVADLQRMAAKHAWTRTASVASESNNQWRAGLENISDALGAVLDDRAGTAEIAFLHDEFMQIAAGTMDASYHVLHDRGTSGSWLTA